ACKNGMFPLAPWLERVPKAGERTAPFRDIREVERHVEADAAKPMGADDFLVGIVHRVKCDGGNCSYFQAALGAFDVLAELIVEMIITAENPHVRVTIQPRQKHAGFDIAARHGSFFAVKKVRSLDFFRGGGGLLYVEAAGGFGDVVALVSERLRSDLLAKRLHERGRGRRGACRLRLVDLVPLLIRQIKIGPDIDPASQDFAAKTDLIDAVV